MSSFSASVIDVIQCFRTDVAPRTAPPASSDASPPEPAPHSPPLAASVLGVESDSSRSAPFTGVASGVFVALFLLASAGCGGASHSGPPRVAVVAVKGQVLYQGRPAAHALVTFHPKSPRAEVPPPRAIADGEGRFAATTYDRGDGAPEGTYTVTVELKKLIAKDGETKPGPNVLPAKYQHAATSTLQVEVTPGKSELPIELK